MTDCAGIGWVLYDKQENIILKGMASIPPTSTPEEAEAEALRSALFQVGRLGYTNVLFCGDASNLYHNIAALESNESRLNQEPFNMRHRDTIFLNSSKLSFPSLSMSKQRIMSCNSSSVHVKSCTVAIFATSLRVMNPFPPSSN